MTSPFSWLALLVALPALAQNAGLSDPTRPPEGSQLAAPAAPGMPAGPRLQSVLLSLDRKLAIIDGQTVALGGTVGDATLIQISETKVTLRRGTQLTTLELYPGVVRSASDKNREGKP
jgi:MSHA biogenesis protein MshK